MINFRKAHEGLRLGTTEEVQKAVHFIDGLPKNVVAFTVATEEETLFIAYNANPEAVVIDLPQVVEWSVYIDGDKAQTTALRKLTKKNSQVEIQGISCLAAVCK